MCLIKQKNKLHSRFLKKRDLSILTAFKKLRNRLTKDLKKAKKEYYEHLFQSARTPDRVWAIINNVLGTHSRQNNLNEITLNGKTLSGTALSEHFSAHYASLPLKHAPSINSFYVLDTNILDTAFFQPTDCSEVYQTFKSLRNSKAIDIDCLQIRPVKHVLDLVCPYLAHIFNLAIESGIFPSKMKEARVSVIHKGGDRNDISNYRPISVLPIFSKGLEKIILSRLSGFFSKHNILSGCQHGFTKGRSTESALLVQKEIILQGIEKGQLTLGIFIDYSKAFDSLHHGILLTKLQQYGIRGVTHSLLHSYLTNRQQSVAINGFVSTPKNLPTGVPQGSILGPFLFNVYVNDLNKIDNETKFILYADDTSLFVTADNDIDLVLRTNSVLSKLHDWSLSNYLHINAKKSKGIIFTAKNKAVATINLTMGPHPIEVVAEHKVLGVTFSNHLQWNSHIDMLIKKLSSAIGVLFRCRHMFPSRILFQLYHSLFRSHLNYCLLIWGTTTKSNINRLLLLEKKAIRCASLVDYFHPTKELFQRNKIVNIERSYSYRLLHQLHFAETKTAEFLNSVSNPVERSSIRLTRERERWLVPCPRTNYLLQSVTHNVPVLLNKLEKRVNKDVGFSRGRLRNMFVFDEFY